MTRAGARAGPERDDTTAVVITHHSPTPRSIAPRFRGSVLNPAFASNLEPLIVRYQPALWIHGYMHNSVGVTVGATCMLANPSVDCLDLAVSKGSIHSFIGPSRERLPS